VSFAGENNELLYDKKTMMVSDVKTKFASREQLMKKQEPDMKSAA
jgi:hypothetical protein